ncbi:MAG TPA: hypothetical protein VKR60_09260 [Candidatus Sulfotelmatobacter sp.]|nr:hypothetical protein [Candidatus Sulfotelmatobacter sp.]
MHIPRLPVLSLLILVCAVPSVAQSSPEKSSVHLQSWTTAPQSDPASIRVDQLQTPFYSDGLSLRYAAPGTFRLGEHAAAILSPRQFHKRIVTNDDVPCLTLRTYRVTRDDPESDTTRLVGYSTCQPSTRFQVKTTVESQRIVPR